MQRRLTAGFTLLELLVVLVILGLLAALVAPRVLQQVGSSKRKTAALQIEEYSAALSLYHMEVGRHPTTVQGLEALIEKPAGTRGWSGPYLAKKQIHDDPWGNPYSYKSPGDHRDYDLYSLGADGLDGGDDDDADVVNWQ